MFSARGFFYRHCSCRTGPPIQLSGPSRHGASARNGAPTWRFP
jgi:hypothetical protein